MASAKEGLLDTVTTRMGVKLAPPQDFIGCEIMSNLPLQMSLYYNACFSPIWFSATVLSLVVKHSSLPEIDKFVSPTVLVLMTIMECVRLLCGYRGNLYERVPALAAFWMLSLVLQLPLCLYSLLNTSTIRLPLELSVQIILLLFLLFELIVSTVTIKDMAAVQETKFNLLQDSTLEKDE